MLVALFFLSHRSCDTARSVLGPQYSLLPEVLSTQVFVAMLGAKTHIIKCSTVNCYNTKNSTNMNSLFGASLKTNSMITLVLDHLLWYDLIFGTYSREIIKYYTLMWTNRSTVTWLSCCYVTCLARYSNLESICLAFSPRSPRKAFMCKATGNVNFYCLLSFLRKKMSAAG